MGTFYSSWFYILAVVSQGSILEHYYLINLFLIYFYFLVLILLIMLTTIPRMYVI